MKDFVSKVEDVPEDNTMVVFQPPHACSCWQTGGMEESRTKVKRGMGKKEGSSHRLGERKETAADS